MGNMKCKIGFFVAALFILTLQGCANGNNGLAAEAVSAGNIGSNLRMEEELLEKTELCMEEISKIILPPVISQKDWSEYFGGINGVAVLYNPAENEYMIYNQMLADTRRSPCSTFKIVSSLSALEHGVIVPDNSVHIWNGETFWNEEWNRDIDFPEAFRASCVWYFREVVDEIGKERMQAELDRLQYGNCDISDWEGRLNTNNNNRDLTGFWIESSLKISPKEQVEVMERIFGSNSGYKEETLNQLKEVMRVLEQQETNMPVYGKTGMGKANGVVVDAWFTGFADTADGNVYFCVYLGETDGKNVSSTRAKEIALEIVAGNVK